MKSKITNMSGGVGKLHLFLRGTNLADLNNSAYRRVELRVWKVIFFPLDPIPAVASFLPVLPYIFGYSVRDSFLRFPKKTYIMQALKFRMYRKGAFILRD